MKRTYIYTLLALPLIVVALVLAVTPSSTRAMFISEFKHRARLMMGYQPEPIGDGSRGLRLERPDEYGPQPGGEETEQQEDESTD